MTQTTEAAHAKINLCLDITARRENGYHEIDGVMQSISLADRLVVAFEPAGETGVELRVEGNSSVPTDEKNLAVRAARLFLDSAGITGAVRIDLQKQIPMAGGLAGGSTDAAAVLRALNRLTCYPLTAEELATAGLRLGADVPFCLTGGTMRTQGIGEVLTPCALLPECHIVITRRGEGVSTPWAYGRLDELYGSFAPGAARPDANLPALLGALEAGDLARVCAGVYNLFEPVVSEARRDVTVLRERLLADGALTARMSGSGPCVFGIFNDAQKALFAVKDLTGIGAEAFLCRPSAPEFL